MNQPNYQLPSVQVGLGEQAQVSSIAEQQFLISEKLATGTLTSAQEDEVSYLVEWAHSKVSKQFP